MTTPWKVPPDLFAGQTVAVLASGPSLTQALADSVRHLPRVCARLAVRFAPDADIVVAIDGPANPEFWEDTRDFPGLRICGAECDIDALYLHMPHEVVTLGEGHVVQFRNNGLSAIRIAADAGAAKILLLGFDTDGYAGTEGLGDTGLTVALNALMAELRARGIEVEHLKAAEAE